MFLKKVILASLLFVSGCGFSPLYMQETENGVAKTEQITVSPIPEYHGYVLKQGLDDAFNPQKKHVEKKYILNVSLSSPQLSSQSIQGDNFASRKKVTLKASYSLIDKETKAVLLTSSTQAIGAFNVFYEPYTTYQSEKNQVDNLVQILITNISTRVVSYFKQQEVTSESKANTN